MYEINVTRRTKLASSAGQEDSAYLHYFRTHERSLDTQEKALEVFQHFQLLFPAPEYDVSISRSLGAEYCTAEFLTLAKATK